MLKKVHNKKVLYRTELELLLFIVMSYNVDSLSMESGDEEYSF